MDIIRHLSGGAAIRTMALLAVPLLAAAGCGGSGYPWYREGITADELREDEKACLAESRGYGFVNPDLDQPGATVPGGGPAGRVVQREEGDLFRACMNARGYARVPPPPERTAK